MHASGKQASNQESTPLPALQALAGHNACKPACSPARPPATLCPVWGSTSVCHCFCLLTVCFPLPARSHPSIPACPARYSALQGPARAADRLRGSSFTQATGAVRVCRQSLWQLQRGQQAQAERCRGAGGRRAGVSHCCLDWLATPLAPRLPAAVTCWASQLPAATSATSATSATTATSATSAIAAIAACGPSACPHLCLSG